MSRRLRLCAKDRRPQIESRIRRSDTRNALRYKMIGLVPGGKKLPL